MALILDLNQAIRIALYKLVLIFVLMISFFFACAQRPVYAFVAAGVWPAGLGLAAITAYTIVTYRTSHLRIAGGRPTA